MNAPDFKRDYRLAQLAAGAYGIALNELSLLCASHGLDFIDVIQAPGFQCMVAHDPTTGEYLRVHRGTPVTCGRDIEDAITALGYDAGFAKRRIGDGLVLKSVFDALHAEWGRVNAPIPSGAPVIDTGHSLGGVFALGSAALTPRTQKLTTVAFAPFQAADARFWKTTFDGRDKTIYGRAADFAPGHDHLDPQTTQPWPIWHLVNSTCTQVTDWPFCDESIPDHDVAGYVADLKALAAESAPV